MSHYITDTRICINWLKYVRLKRKDRLKIMRGKTLEIAMLADACKAHSNYWYFYYLDIILLIHVYANLPRTLAVCHTHNRPVSHTQGRIQADAIDANASVRKNLPMHSSVRFLPQIIRNSTFCENTRPIMQKFQQSYFFLEMTTTHILNLHLEDLFSPKHALELLRWHSRLWYISRCFKIYYSIMSISRFSSWILYMISRVHVLNVFMQSHICQTICEI